MDMDKEIELGYSLWQLALNRPEWFRNARQTRMQLEAKRAALVSAEGK